MQAGFVGAAGRYRTPDPGPIAGGVRGSTCALCAENAEILSSQRRFFAPFGAGNRLSGQRRRVVTAITVRQNRAAPKAQGIFSAISKSLPPMR